MNQLHTNAPPVPAGDAEQDANLLDLLIVVLKHKKMIFSVTVAAAVAALAISFMLPEVYRADARLLPPAQQQSGAAALLSQIGGAAGAMAGAAGIKNPNDTYIGMLKSRTVADKLVARYDLKKHYDTVSQEKARRLLGEATLIMGGKDGLITIEVESEDRIMVAKLVNSYIDELMLLTRQLAVTEAGQRRVFFERQLELSKDNLAAAEVALKGALDTRGVISVDSDSRAIVETVSRMRAQISAKEIQLSAMRAFVTEDNPQYKRVREELSSMRAELFKLENGRPAGTGQPDSARGAGLENIKILRDVKYHQMLYELLAKQYEMARLDEAKEAAVVQVLDPATEPEKKFKPKRAIITVVTTLFAFLAAVALAFVLEARRRAQGDPVARARWDRFRQALRLR